MIDLKIIVRGAGEMASGVGLRLFRSGFHVAYTEIENPLCVRRTVSYSPAVTLGKAEVEGVPAVLAGSVDEVLGAWSAGGMSVLIDPELNSIGSLKPDVIVDATVAKTNLGLNKDMAPLVIALGPGFNAGIDADVVIETNRGHNLGRLIFEGPADANTGQPGTIAGETSRRVLRAPTDGEVVTDLEIGALVTEGQTVMEIGGVPVPAGLDGAVRGLIRPGTRVWSGLKVGDVDPRGDDSYCYTVSDKARAIGGSVLEAVLQRYNR